MADEKTADETGSAGKKGGKGLLVVLILLVLLLAGGGGAVYLFKDKLFGSEAPTGPKEEQNRPEPVPAESLEGKEVSLDPFSVNLQDQDTFLEIELVLYVKKDPDLDKLLVERKYMIRDTVNVYLMGLSRAMIEDDQKNNNWGIMKREIINRLNDRLGSGSVLDVYVGKCLIT